MNVVTFVARGCLARLECALAGSHSLRPLTSLHEMQRELDEGRGDVGVIDLDACPDSDLRLLTAIVSRHGPALIAYGASAPPAVRKMADLARHGLCHIIFRGVDDLPSSFRRAVRDAAGTRLSAAVLDRLTPMLCPAGDSFRHVISQLFYEPLRFRSPAEVAEAAGIARRTLDRTLCTLDLEPARTFLLAARVTWAYPRMRSARIRVCDISRQLGVAKPERFAQHTRFLLGLPPSILRTQVSPDQFVEMIVARLRRQPRAAARGIAYDHRAGTSVSPGASMEAEPLLREGIASA